LSVIGTTGGLMFSNYTKVWLFIVGICLFFLVTGYNVGGRIGLMLGLAISIAINVLIFFYGETHILSLLKVRQLQGQDPWGLQNLIKELSAKLRIKKEFNLYVINTPAAVAFSVSIAWRKPCICLSEGLLKRFTPEELQAVVAHQMVHIRKLDTFGFGVTSILANTLVGLGQFLDQLWPPNFFLDKKQQPFLTLFSPLGWLIIRAVVHKKTYLKNDILAAELIGDRKRLAEVLWKLEGLAQTQPLLIPPCTSHLFIVNPEGFEQRNLFLKSHPPIKKRLLNLLGYYPI
jgi:heat shock protein HtpX